MPFPWLAQNHNCAKCCWIFVLPYQVSFDHTGLSDENCVKCCSTNFMFGPSKNPARQSKGVGTLILSSENCAKQQFGGFCPIWVSSGNCVKWQFGGFGLSGNVGISWQLGRRRRRIGCSTKKVKINTRLTAAPAASITHNFRWPSNCFSHICHIKLLDKGKDSELKQQQRQGDRGQFVSFFCKESLNQYSWLNWDGVAGGGIRHNCQLALHTTWLEPAHTRFWQRKQQSYNNKKWQIISIWTNFPDFDQIWYTRKRSQTLVTKKTYLSRLYHGCF